jgi:hypothetical protein
VRLLRATRKSALNVTGMSNELILTNCCNDTVIFLCYRTVQRLDRTEAILSFFSTVAAASLRQILTNTAPRVLLSARIDLCRDEHTGSASCFVPSAHAQNNTTSNVYCSLSKDATSLRLSTTRARRLAILHTAAARSTCDAHTSSTPSSACYNLDNY